MSYGDVRFIGLNTNLDSSPDSPQYEWLAAEMQSLDFMQAHWRIVLFHQPPYTCANVHQEDLTVQTYLVPLLNSMACIWSSQVTITSTNGTPRMESPIS